MDRKTLSDQLGLMIVDRYSADTITLGIKAVDGLIREALYLKEVGAPSPSVGRYGNIHCVLWRPGRPAACPGLIVLDPSGRAAVDRTPWLRELARSGVVVLGLDFPKEAAAEATSTVLKAVTYLDLRRDVVASRRIFISAAGKHSAWGLAAAALDDRVAGVALVDPVLRVELPDGRSLSVPLVDPALRVNLPGGRSFSVTAVAELLPPRRLAVLGVQDGAAALSGTVAAYAAASREEALRLEDAGGTDQVGDAIRWLLAEEQGQ